MNAQPSLAIDADRHDRIMDQRSAIRPDGHLLVMMSLLLLIKAVMIVGWLM